MTNAEHAVLGSILLDPERRVQMKKYLVVVDVFEPLGASYGSVGTLSTKIVGSIEAHDEGDAISQAQEIQSGFNRPENMRLVPCIAVPRE